MSFNIKHGVGAGPVAAAGFAGGQGAARRRGGSLPLTELGRSRLGERKRPEEQPEDPRLALQANELADRALQREWQAGQSLEAFNRSELSKEIDNENKRAFSQFESNQRRDDLEFSLTTKQKQELDNLANVEADAMASSDYTPDEKAEIRRRIAAKRAGITPVERPKAPTPEELFKQRTFTDARTGRVYALDADGVPGRAIYEPPEKEPTYNDRISGVEKAAKLSTNAETGEVDGERMSTLLGRMGLEEQAEGPAAWTQAYRGDPAGDPSGAESGQPGAPAGQPGAAPQAAAEEGPGLASRIGTWLFGKDVPPGTPTKDDPTGLKGLYKETAELVREPSAEEAQGVHDPEDVQNLGVMEFQLEAARAEVVRYQKELDTYAGRPEEEIPSTIGKRKRKAEERTRALEAREIELRRKKANLLAEVAGRRAAAASKP